MGRDGQGIVGWDQLKEPYSFVVLGHILFMCVSDLVSVSLNSSRKGVLWHWISLGRDVGAIVGEGWRDTQPGVNIFDLRKAHEWVHCATPAGETVFQSFSGSAQCPLYFLFYDLTTTSLTK